MRRDKILCTAGVCTNFAADISKQIKANTTAVNLCENFESSKWHVRQRENGLISELPMPVPMVPVVCDGWWQSHSQRPEQGIMSYDNLLCDRATDIMRGYLNSSTPPVDTPADRKSFTLVKTAYVSCLFVSELKRVGLFFLCLLLVVVV